MNSEILALAAEILNTDKISEQIIRRFYIEHYHIFSKINIKGITHHVLLWIKNQDEVTSAMISEEFNIPQATVSVTLRRLYDKGYLKKEYRQEENKNGVIVKLAYYKKNF